MNAITVGSKVQYNNSQSRATFPYIGTVKGLSVKSNSVLLVAWDLAEVKVIYPESEAVQTCWESLQNLELVA